MQKIKNLTLQETDISIGIKWAEIDSKISSLIKETDWIFLNDSEVVNLEEWKRWRKSVRSVRVASDGIYGKAISILKNLEENKPEIRYNSIQNYEYDHRKYETIQKYKEEIIVSLYSKYNKILLDKMINSGVSGLFHFFAKETDTKTQKIIDDVYFEIKIYLDTINRSNDIKALENIYREIHGHRH